MVTILVTMTVRPEDAPEFEATLDALMPFLRETEPDTLRFDYYRVGKQDGVYRLFEVYASREAFDFHINNPATESQRSTFKRLLTGPTEVQFLTALGGK
ncbi:putative quinol monooxygenase [Sphingobium sp. EM0848]|uniref:putative quinol monooxygenase n=1 Tax=Sphingobium sp. EM0848 TaxID=2743473 RepID=UPI00159C57A3|nr:putative quinol monooxygenase [Sphingobium sp. EM0848]